MKKLDLSTVTDTSQFPLKVGTLNFINQAYQEGLNALANNLIGQQADSTRGFILWGCQNSGSGSTYTISAGGVYYNGEIYLVDAVPTFTVTGGNIAGASYTSPQQYYTGAGTYADPVTFTDGASRYVHQINKITFSNIASGISLFSFSDMVQTGVGLKNDQQGVSFPASYTVSFEQDKATFFTAQTSAIATTLTFDFTNAVAGSVVRLKIPTYTGSSLTVTPGSASIIKDSGTFTEPATNLIYFIYLGLNEAGVNEVSYTIKSI